MRMKKYLLFDLPMAQKVFKDTLIDIKELTWSYPHASKKVFDQFSFKLGVGDFTILMGKSGSWKSTLVKFLLRQLKPDKKTVYVLNEDIALYDDQQVQRHRKHIGVILQEHALLEHQTVRQALQMPLLVHDTPSNRMDQMIDQVLQKIGMQHTVHQRIQELSGGEKQKIALARALITDPSFVIADEPTGNLDFESAAAVADALLEVHRQGQTILLITHDKLLVDYILKQNATTICYRLI